MKVAPFPENPLTGAGPGLASGGRPTQATAAMKPVATDAGGKNGERPGALLFRGRRPVELSFGTSGLRGLVRDITDLEAYINTRGFLEYALERGDVASGGEVSLAADLRPSSDGPERSILRAVARAVLDAGLRPDLVGHLPTPALMFYALQRKQPSVMVTGSHIPFDRNGIKFNLSTGEVLKSDEAAIFGAVDRVRRSEYSRPDQESPFADDGRFKHGQDRPLPEINSQAALDYLCRYLNFFRHDALEGRRIIFYQHSAVGRDLLKALLVSLGAEVISVGRSETFVPVDTEAIPADMLQLLQRFADQVRREHGDFDTIVSTDGDSDRPLLAAITPEGQVQFCGGDLLGIITADFLGADTVAVPISANDAVDRWAAAQGAAVLKTRVGSPYVIEAMQQARARGARRVVGWEANGGFLTATDIERWGRTLVSLPTRDAALPLVATLCAANERGISLSELFAELPRRFGKSGLIDHFPPETSRALLHRFSPLEPDVQDVIFTGPFVTLRRANGKIETACADGADMHNARRQDLERFFPPEKGFGRVLRLNLLDGLRFWFGNGDIAHIRPSGNAPQLRIYAVADTPARADEIVALGLCEPDGILRRMQNTLASPTDAFGFVEGARKNPALVADGTAERP
jgi:phosphomannomutase